MRRREIPQPDALPDTGQNRCGVLALNGTIRNVSSLLRTRLSIRQDNFCLSACFNSPGVVVPVFVGDRKMWRSEGVC